MFKITILGQIKRIKNESYLICSDSKLKVSSAGNYPEGNLFWEVVPSIDPDGIIKSVKIESFDTEGKEECLMTGIVAQTRKNNSSVQLKIQRPAKKTLRLTLLSALPTMEEGQQWEVNCFLQGESLFISEAKQLEISEKKGNAKLLASKSVAPKSKREFTELRNKAISILEDNTGLATGWQLTRKLREEVIEWDAINGNYRGRVEVNLKTEATKVLIFDTPKTPNLNIANSERLTVIPLGAARSIGASCFQIKIGPYEIVLDCGTKHGDNPLPALEYLENPDLLLISHAHQDHIGAVPVFQAKYPGTPIICTKGTREIARIMLTDCLKLQQREDSPELFDVTDLDRTLFKMQTMPVGHSFEPLPGLKVRFINAGHILGAACIYLKYGERTLLYTGDYHIASSRTTVGLNLEDLPTADILITESTYGADAHPSRKSEETALMDAIASVIRAGGNVLIPTFALGRAQEIILAIRTNALFHSLPAPIYVDGLVRSVTEVFRENLDLLPKEVKNLANRNSVEPFFDENSTPAVIPIADKDERPLAMAKPSVIIASSGMLTGGPSVYYAKTLLERENAAIFISGYTDEESPGRLLQNLSTGDEIELDGTLVTVRAQIRRFNLSAHTDKVGLTRVISKVSPKNLILIHGSGNSLHKLANAGNLKSKYLISIPSVGEEIKYGDIPEQISREQLAAIEMPNSFEIIMEAEYDGAWLRVPQDVVDNDPRWRRLVDIGILKAEWVGNKLLLNGITSQNIQQEITVEKMTAVEGDFCANCAFFHMGYCGCSDSSLFELKVAPTGSCPDFQGIKNEI